MNYTKEERTEISRKIYTHEITIGEASIQYGLYWYTARDYMRQYRDLNSLPPMDDGKDALKILHESKRKKYDDLESLSKDELINEVIKARVETARAKKGYVVKEGGQEKYDVIVAPNLYGDILSDLIAGLTGVLGLVPSANIGDDVAIFEAVHGSAPDIAGKGIANPIGMLLASCMMLDYLDEHESAEKIRHAVKYVLDNKLGLTPDLGGKGTTKTLTQEIINHLK